MSREQCECLDSALPRPRRPLCVLYAAVGLPLTQYACLPLRYGFTAVAARRMYIAQIVLIGYSRTQSKVSFGHRATTHSNSVLAPSVP